MPGRIGFEANLGATRDPRNTMLRRSETMRLLVLGDFSGRQNRERVTATDLGRRPIMELDLDSFDIVFRRLSPRLAFNVGRDDAQGIDIEFESLDDFHPDNLYRSLEPFRKLRESRSRLLDPTTFEQEATRVLGSENPAAGVAEAGHAIEPQQQEEATDLLTRLIGAPTAAAAQQVPAPGFVDGLIRRLVQPHIKQASTRAPEPYVAALDASATDLMRALLHQPDFQALEANWRGVRRLVDSLDLGSALKLSLLDISKSELLADLEASRGNLQESAVHRLLVEAGQRGADGQPWSLLVGQYRFGADGDDVALLAHLGVIASQAGGPIVAEADPRLVGCDALNERTEPRLWAFKDAEAETRWDALRRSPVARWLGLAMPRVLLRLPYGARTDRVDSFAFEEFAASASHEAYLWGNPALACAQVMARSFLEDDEDTAVAGPHDIEDLPAHVRDQDGERHLQACAEYVLPVRVGEEMLQRGMIPLQSYGNRNAVRVVQVQSIAEPGGALARFG